MWKDPQLEFSKPPATFPQWEALRKTCLWCLYPLSEGAIPLHPLCMAALPPPLLDLIAHAFDAWATLPNDATRSALAKAFVAVCQAAPRSTQGTPP